MVNHMHAAKYFPEAYEGTLIRHGKENTIIEIATDLEYDTIIKRFGDWVVMTTGIDCLTQGYFIASNRLDEDDWIEHVGSKPWVNESDFSLAYYAAKDLAKLAVI